MLQQQQKNDSVFDLRTYIPIVVDDTHCISGFVSCGSYNGMTSQSVALFSGSPHMETKDQNFSSAQCHGYRVNLIAVVE